MHDLDEVQGATVFNAPIAQAVGNAGQIFILQNCIEDVLGYAAPTSNKPFEAYKITRTWETWENIPTSWLNVVNHIFSDEIPVQVAEAA